MKWGIRTQVLLALCVILGFGLFASYWITSNVTSDAVYQGAMERLAQSARFAKRTYQKEGQAGLNALNTTIAPDRALLMDGDGKVSQPSGLKLDSALSEQGATLRDGMRIDAGDGTQWLIAMRELEASNFRLIIAAPLTATSERVALLERLLLLFTVVIVLLALVPGYVLLGRLVIRPLQRLVRMVDRVGGGEFTRETSLDNGGNEVKQLVLALDRMQAQLAKDRAQIEEQLRELTSTNTELRDAKERLVLSEKLATVGTLAAGVAHEIGNPMAVLQGYAELLREESLSESQRIEYAVAVEQAVQKVSTIIRDLLEFARPVDQSDDTCDVHVAIRRAMNLVAHQPSFRAIDMALESSEEPLYAQINSGRLEQVLLNLLLNASHASSQGSTVAIGTEDQGDHVLLSVSDTGDGIPPALLSKIFDPFFTTKEPGSGTGLGLSICHNSVTGFGGDIDVRSSEGEGTTFRITLLKAEM